MSITRRTYQLRNWIGWDDELNAFVEDFRGHFGVAPNVLLANEVTYARIDLAAKKYKIRNAEGESPGEFEFAPLSTFAGDDYELTFAIDQQLADKAMSLIYDTDPDGGGEPIPDEDTPLDVVNVRRAQ